MKPPRKPHPDFPLTPCANGMWRKIVHGKPYTFGPWRDDLRGERAIKEWLARKDTILAGLEVHTKTPVVAASDLTLGRMVKDYLKLRSADVQNGSLSSDQFRDLTAALIPFVAFYGETVKAQGFTPSIFARYRTELDKKGWSPHTLKRVLANVKACFNFAMEMESIQPIRFGPRFVAPPTDDSAIAQHKLRKGLADHTEIILTRRQIRRLLHTAKQQSPEWTAFILLMLNTASNPAEIARFKWSEIKGRRLERRRWKKGIRQDAFLWKRTLAALAALPRNKSEYIFVRADGRLWVDSQAVLADVDGDRIVSRTKRWNFITRDFLPLAEMAELPHVTPYTIRRTARTLAAHCKDDNAAKRMMGQALSGQDRRYVKRAFPLHRLRSVSKTIYLRAFKPRSSPAAS